MVDLASGYCLDHALREISLIEYFDAKNHNLAKTIMKKRPSRGNLTCRNGSCKKRAKYFVGFIPRNLVVQIHKGVMDAKERGRN